MGSDAKHVNRKKYVTLNRRVTLNLFQVPLLFEMCVICGTQGIPKQVWDDGGERDDMENGSIGTQKNSHTFV